MFTKRTFDFANLATSSELEFVVLRALPVVRAGEAVLRVRVHSATIPSAASIKLSAQAVAPCADEPQTDFLGPLVGLTELTSTVSPPALASIALSPDFGSHVQLVLTGSRGATGGTFSAVLSADLVLKPRTADPALLRLQTQHAYVPGDSALWFIPFIGTTPVATLTSSTIEARMTAIHDGWLERVIIFTTAAAGATTIGLHINGSASALISRSATVSTVDAETFEFGQDAKFSRGDRMSISVDPTNIPGNLNVQAEWVFRRST